MIENKNSFNRSLNLILDYHKKQLNLTVLFNKCNTYTAFHIEPKCYYSLKQKNNINVCFDLKKSKFCNTFLDMQDFESDNCSYTNYIHGIFTQYKDIMYYDSKDCVTMDRIVYGNTFIENKIDIDIIKLYKFCNDFLMCVVNRQIVNEKTKKKIIRSSFMCIYSKECFNYITSLYKKYNIKSQKYESCKDAMESLFHSDLTPQQIQNGVQL